MLVTLVRRHWVQVFMQYSLIVQNITEKDIFDALKKLENSELVGKNNPKGGVSGDSSNDKVHFKLALNTTSYKAVVGAGSS